MTRHTQLPSSDKAYPVKMSLILSTIVFYARTARMWLRMKWYRSLSAFKTFWNFHTTWTTYILVTGMVGGAIISGLDGLPYIDGLFLAMSAITGTGLSTVSMNSISFNSFIILAILMFIGGIIFLLLPVPLYRQYCYRSIKNKVTAVDSAVLYEHEALYAALGVYWRTIAAYIILFHVIGAVLLYAALEGYDSEPPTDRRFTRVAHAVFLTISSYANAGFGLTNDNVAFLRNNPPSYIILSFLILGGNTAAPIILRAIFHYAHKRARRTHSNQYAPFKYIIDNPRRISTHIFSHRETLFLCASVIGLNLVQYAFYLGSTLNRKEAMDEYDSQAMLIGMGYFQTISTRAAGLQIMNLRLMNQGMLVVYVVMMYLSAAPFVSTMYKSEQDAEIMAKGSPDEDSSDEEEEYDLEAGHDSARRRHSGGSEEPVEGEDTLVDKEGAVITTTTEKKIHRRKSNSGGSITSLVDIMKTESVTKQFAAKFLMRHSFFLIVAVFVCSFSEDNLLTQYPENVNLWYIVFEIISAYGNVGLSLGFPGENYSLCGRFGTLGKFVIILVMILGKHRGLPSSHDAVIDFQFARFKRYSRRGSKSSSRQSKDTVKIQSEQSSISVMPSIQREKSIALIELKASEKIRLNAVPARRNTSKVMPVLEEMDLVHEMESKRRKSDSHIVLPEDLAMQKCLSVDSYATSSRRRSMPKCLVSIEPKDVSNDEKRDDSTETTLVINHEIDAPAPEVAV